MAKEIWRGIEREWEISPIFVRKYFYLGKNHRILIFSQIKIKNGRKYETETNG